MIGIAAGLASRNRVVICHALAVFTMRSYEFIRTDLGISRANVNLVDLCQACYQMAMDQLIKQLKIYP